MRKPLISRIAALSLLYCAVFCILAIVQFSNKGNFSLTAGAMTIRGRYLLEPQQASFPQAVRSSSVVKDEIGIKRITGGIKLFFGGLEFSLKEERGKGLTLAGDDFTTPVNPEYLILTDSTVHFGLPGGTIVVFYSFDSPGGQGLQISAEFTEDISQVIIPITPRRSSLFNDNGRLGIFYSGSQYLFNRDGQELENGTIVLSRENPFISYRSRELQRGFDPVDFIIALSENYDNTVVNWRDENFARWNRNAAALQNEDDINAYLSEALVRGNYTAAGGSISSNFVNSSGHSYRSAVFVGGISNAYRLFIAAENEKLNTITRLTGERSLDILKEEHILDYLFVRNNASAANSVIDIIVGAGAESITSDYCPGLLEAYSDFKYWRSSSDNPVEHLTEHILLVISENLHRDGDNDLVFASNSEGVNPEYSLRLGKALIPWAQANHNAEWTAIGRSLVLSALTGGDGNAGKLYSILRPEDYYPRAARLSDNGHWTWTVSPSVSMSNIDGNLNISASFPVNMTHYMIIRGVRPFIRMQIHDMDWRTDSQFERYDSSGWVYYSQEQVLILKLKHRTSVENIRVFYRAEEPPPPPPPPPAPVVEEYTGYF